MRKYKQPVNQFDIGRRKVMIRSALVCGAMTLAPLGRLFADEQSLGYFKSVRFKKDGLSCAIIKAGGFNMSPAQLFPQATEHELKEHNLNVEKIPFAIHSLFVDTGKNKIVIDPGGINESDNLVSKFEGVGINPGNIDTVIITHAHYDHFLGCVNSNGEPAFPNAKYILQKGEWDYWQNTEDGEEHLVSKFRKLLVPIREQFELINGEVEIVAGVKALPTPGHSPGHMTVHIGKSIAYTGDTILQPVQVAHQEWCAEFNRWPEQVLSSREKFLKRVAKDKALVVGTHFPSPAVGFVDSVDKGYHWKRENLPVS